MGVIGRGVMGTMGRTGTGMMGGRVIGLIERDAMGAVGGRFMGFIGRGVMGARGGEGISLFPNECHVIIQIPESIESVIDSQATGSSWTKCRSTHAPDVPAGHAQDLSRFGTRHESPEWFADDYHSAAED